MRTIWLSHPACTAHENPPDNPETPQRVLAVHSRAQQTGLLARMHQCMEAPRAARAALERVHTAQYVDRLHRLAPASGRIHLDYDTSMMPATLEAALRAAGAVIEGVDQVMSGGAEAAFCNVRPPGHHAEHSRAMGFCLLNSVAAGAAHALAHHGLQRVAVIDFDVHHGNGTEQMLLALPGRTLMCSLYQCPLYPNHVAATGTGHMVNVPLSPGEGSDALQALWHAQWQPALRAFRPELLMISAGFDAHEADPLGALSLHTDDYTWLTAALVNLCCEVGARGIVSSLEGGYDVAALAECACAHVMALVEG